MNTEEKIRKYISQWEKQGYEDGIPDEAPLELEKNLLVPSYRMICRALMKNDHSLKTLGFEREPCELYSVFKRIELKERGVIKVMAIQYGLFGEDYECI